MAKETNGEVPRGTSLSEIGEKFLLRRTKLKKQIKVLAAESGVSDATISGLEKGQIVNTSIKTLELVAEALGMSIRITADEKE